MNKKLKSALGWLPVDGSMIRDADWDGVGKNDAYEAGLKDCLAVAKLYYKLHGKKIVDA